MAQVSSISLGFGTAGFESRSLAVQSVKEALEVGYRHLDTAQQYSHSAAVGEAIAETDVPREEIFVATKLHSKNLTHEAVLTETRAILDRLGLDTIDLLYVHWPAHTYGPAETFGAMGELVESGAVRRVGGCNFTVDLLREAIATSPVPLFANQIEMHPFLPQADLLETCRAEGIEVVAHTPLAGGAVFRSDVLRDIATERGATVPQVVLAWLLGRPACPIPKATGDHIGENYAATALELTSAERARIDAIEEEHRVVDYDFAPWSR
ncbi:aldo/keto reductase [Halobaculum magnesiiphilum]|uniref:Aldo/keto reductase n=1 Tax=Halobaculum magnesiiphilum TaxID=1017351 RepID=A0A8T8WCN7_9EURY|nr:aldo/keto reductase [Halobaculum magnesiiphilum]QZP37523.1 aldo/keto reductase [Halobaculum magnesiiphilum]